MSSISHVIQVKILANALSQGGPAEFQMEDPLRVTNQLCSFGFISQDKNRQRELTDKAAEIIDFLVVYWCTHLSTKKFIQSVTSMISVSEY